MYFIHATQESYHESMLFSCFLCAILYKVHPMLGENKNQIIHKEDISRQNLLVGVGKIRFLVTYFNTEGRSTASCNKAD